MRQFVLGHNADVGVAKMCDSALGVTVPGVATAAPRISSLPTTSTSTKPKGKGGRKRGVPNKVKPAWPHITLWPDARTDLGSDFSILLICHRRLNWLLLLVMAVCRKRVTYCCGDGLEWILANRKTTRVDLIIRDGPWGVLSRNEAARTSGLSALVLLLLFSLLM